MDSTYLTRQRGASRDPRRAGRTNQGAGHDDRQQHHYRIQQHQHQSQHHHQVSTTLLRITCLPLLEDVFGDILTASDTSYLLILFFSMSLSYYIYQSKNESLLTND
ncbi:hypothetical protein PEX2_020280 [Penicillium expansum]|uniref:Uncharacterized protein n=1 Tax=Penicillium expansum TaxID=27334 RepID=A0A0A2JQC0_PENEN|nr:hypothetical protein PEX2_020280 [Penicillium expansum]KGO57584.1 hypothetical protein PEX2_020280 [Penicillium expansum]